MVSCLRSDCRLLIVTALTVPDKSTTSRERGNWCYIGVIGLYRSSVGVIWGLYTDNGK